MANRLPNFVYIGPGKSGSTWLHETLSRHPEVYLTPAKELHFFDRYYDRGLDWYVDHFKHAGPQHLVVGEVCTSYLFSREAPARLRDSLPDVKLMMTLREPVERTYSSYLYMVKHGTAAGSFREVLETRPRILDPSRYATLVGNYLQHFDRSSLYCSVFDDLRDDPQRYLDHLLEWLELSPMTLEGSGREARLPASSARSTRVARLVRGTAHAARQHGAATLVGRVKRSRLVNRVLYRPLAGEKPAIEPRDAAYVRDQLAPEVVRVEAMLGLDLRGRWGWS